MERCFATCAPLLHHSPADFSHFWPIFHYKTYIKIQRYRFYRARACLATKPNSLSQITCNLTCSAILLSRVLKPDMVDGFLTLQGLSETFRSQKSFWLSVSIKLNDQQNKGHRIREKAKSATRTLSHIATFVYFETWLCVIDRLS